MAIAASGPRRRISFTVSESMRLTQSHNTLPAAVVMSRAR